MLKEYPVYGSYQTIHFLSRKPGHIAGIAINSKECGDPSCYYLLNIYEDPGLAERVKKYLPWVVSSDYVENFEHEQSWVLVFRHHNGTTLQEAFHSCDSLTERLAFVKKAVVFLINQLELFPTAILSGLMKPSSLMLDHGRIRFIYCIEYNEDAPQDIQELMPCVGKFIVDCLPETLQGSARVRRFLKKCVNKGFDKISEFVLEFDRLRFMLVKKYGQQSSYRIYERYEDILENYIPGEKKKSPIAIIISGFILLAATGVGYVYLFGDNHLFIWHNKEIRQFIQNLYENIATWFISLFP